MPRVAGTSILYVMLASPTRVSPALASWTRPCIISRDLAVVVFLESLNRGLDYDFLLLGFLLPSGFAGANIGPLLRRFFWFMCAFVVSCSIPNHLRPPRPRVLRFFQRRICCCYRNRRSFYTFDRLDLCILGWMSALQLLPARCQFYFYQEDTDWTTLPGRLCSLSVLSTPVQKPIFLEICERGFG